MLGLGEDIPKEMIVGLHRAPTKDGAPTKQDPGPLQGG